MAITLVVDSFWRCYCDQGKKCKACLAGKSESAHSPRALGEVRNGARPAHRQRGIDVHAGLVRCGRRPQIWGVGVDAVHAHTWRGSSDVDASKNPLLKEKPLWRRASLLVLVACPPR